MHAFSDYDNWKCTPPDFFAPDEDCTPSPRALDEQAREEAFAGDPKFIEWLVTRPEFVDLADAYAERAVGEHYVRAG